MMMPESMALMLLGARPCASGSQVWSGTRALLTPSPTKKKASPARIQSPGGSAGARLKGGPVMSFSVAQKFASESKLIAVFKRLCDEADVPCQYYVNRSDSPGGSSAGPASITQAAMRAVDVGIPVFAMHSIRELCGVMDNHFVYLAFARFFA